MVLKPSAAIDERLGVLNPACTRLRNGTLQLYPRMVAPGNISRIGSLRTEERPDGVLEVEPRGYVLQPAAPYELRAQPGGYGCEDPRITFVAALDRYVMAYVALGPRGPEVAVAVSEDALHWKRLGLLRFGRSESPFADKDAAFFPEPVVSPSGVESLAFYHRPTLPEEQREGISIGYVSLDAVKANIAALCTVSESHPVSLPPATWGAIKVGGGAPPVRIAEGWLAVIHGVDELAHPTDATRLRYCAGLIVHDATHLDHIIYRSPEPLFVPETPDELHGTVGHVVFPTGIDRRDEQTFDIYYGMADYEIGRGRLTFPLKG